MSAMLSRWWFGEFTPKEPDPALAAAQARNRALVDENEGLKRRLAELSRAHDSLKAAVEIATEMLTGKPREPQA